VTRIIEIYDRENIQHLGEKFEVGTGLVCYKEIPFRGVICHIQKYLLWRSVGTLNPTFFVTFYVYLSCCWIMSMLMSGSGTSGCLRLSHIGRCYM
jgi:hypothetical protein